jgi:hypothetical protein
MMTETHVMHIAEIYDNGLYRMECDKCGRVMLAKPGYTKTLNYGDLNVAHTFAMVDVPIPAGNVFNPPT